MGEGAEGGGGVHQVWVVVLAVQSIQAAWLSARVLRMHAGAALCAPSTEACAGALQEQLTKLGMPLPRLIALARSLGGSAGWGRGWGVEGVSPTLLRLRAWPSSGPPRRNAARERMHA